MKRWCWSDYDDDDDDDDDDDSDVMMMFPVGYTTADVVYQWTAGRGVNIASDMKLSQVWSLEY